MLKLFKFSVLMLFALGGGYLLMGLSLGEKTLFQHLASIAETKEAETLKTEIGKKVDDATTDIRKKAKDLAIEKVRGRLEGMTSNRDTPAADPPSTPDENTVSQRTGKPRYKEPQTADRSSLNRLIREKMNE